MILTSITYLCNIFVSLSTKKVGEAKLCLIEQMKTDHKVVNVCVCVCVYSQLLCKE